MTGDSEKYLPSLCWHFSVSIESKKIHIAGKRGKERKRKKRRKERKRKERRKKRKGKAEEKIKTES